MMHDSGKRQEFETGAVRDTADGKPRPDLISPYADEREGAWMERGAAKYAERNWEKGISISRCVASLRRHLMAYMMGRTDEDHMAAVRTNASFILHYEHEIAAGRLPASLDDMPRYEQRGIRPDNFQMEIMLPQPDGDLTPEAIAAQSSATRQFECDVESMAAPPPCKRPTLYIAGPMRGKPQLNWAAFFDAEAALQAAGYNTINPARLDQERGIDPDTFDLTSDLTPDLLKQIVRSDLDYLISLDPAKGDGLAMLTGWELSVGAEAEYNVARWLTLPRYTVSEWTCCAERGLHV